MHPEHRRIMLAPKSSALGTVTPDRAVPGRSSYCGAPLDRPPRGASAPWRRRAANTEPGVGPLRWCNLRVRLYGRGPDRPNGEADTRLSSNSAPLACYWSAAANVSDRRTALGVPLCHANATCHGPLSAAATPVIDDRTVPGESDKTDKTSGLGPSVARRRRTRCSGEHR
jgi:hypothetical protein